MAADKISRIEFIEKWGLTPVLRPRQDLRPRTCSSDEHAEHRFTIYFLLIKNTLYFFFFCFILYKRDVKEIIYIYIHGRV